MSSCMGVTCVNPNQVSRSSVDKILSCFSTKEVYSPHLTRIKSLFTNLQAFRKDPEHHKNPQSIQRQITLSLKQMKVAGLTFNQSQQVLKVAQQYVKAHPGTQTLLAPVLEDLIAQNKSLELQNRILQGDVAFVKQLIEQGVSVDAPLPNEELPLHFAVRYGKQEVVRVLLGKGANPEVKDFQNVSAIDHAVLQRNENLLALLLAHKLGKAVDDMKGLIQCRAPASHINKLKKKVANIIQVNERNLPPLHKAAYQGNVQWLTENLPTQNVNQVDANGFVPLHYAILGGRRAVMNALIESGANVQILTKGGDSVLHLAALRGSLPILELVVGKVAAFPALLNFQNANGETALHYAALHENLAFVEALVKKGADLSVKDQKNMSPLALIEIGAFQRDPLTLSDRQRSLFLMICANQLAQMALASGWVSGKAQQDVIAFYTKMFPVLLFFYEFSFVTQSLDLGWKKALALAGFVGVGDIPPFSLGFQAWKTYHVARTALEGMKTCWRNVACRKGAIAQNVIVNTVNTSYSFSQLYSEARNAFAFCRDFPYRELFVMGTAWYQNNEYAYEEAKGDFFRRYFGGESQDFQSPTCSQIDLPALTKMSPVERLRNPDLDPKCVEHALWMMSPHFTLKDLEQQGEALFVSTYRKLALKFHPDKTGKNETLTDALNRLNNARDTLKAWCAAHKGS